MLHFSNDNMRFAGSCFVITGMKLEWPVVTVVENNFITNVSTPFCDRHSFHFCEFRNKNICIALVLLCLIHSSI